ncbi:MAG: hypothetical protein HY784_06085 [Chloroflexi bacterium]|nr:hypothetical protein [Chloroflexota bacterium]
MAPAVYNTIAVDIEAAPQSPISNLEHLHRTHTCPGHTPAPDAHLPRTQVPGGAGGCRGVQVSQIYWLRVSGSSIRFSGYLAVYEEARDEDAAEEEETETTLLPDMSEGELLDLLRLLPEQHFTQPPPRYTEASLVKVLEENGIGRPSTYAPILSTVQQRGYVVREDKRLAPTETGMVRPAATPSRCWRRLACPARRTAANWWRARPAKAAPSTAVRTTRSVTSPRGSARCPSPARPAAARWWQPTSSQRSV